MSSTLFGMVPKSVDSVVLLWIGPSFKKSGKDFGTLASFVPEQSLTVIFEPETDSVSGIGRSNGNPGQ